MTTEPTFDVTIGLSSSNTGEGTVGAASLTFTSVSWSVSQTVTLTGVNDFLIDGDVVYTVVTTATSGDGNYGSIDPGDVSVTNQDDDAAGVTVNPTSGLSTSEAGGTAQFTVVLTREPTAEVVIGLTSSNTAEGTVLPASVTFTSLTWSTVQTVTVTGVNDLVADGDILYTIATGDATSVETY